MNLIKLLFSYGIYFSIGLLTHLIFYGPIICVNALFFIVIFLWPLVLLYELLFILILLFFIVAIIFIGVIMVTPEDYDHYR